MTHNHTHDADLIAAIDRRLNQGEPTGVPALDDLAGTVPRSRPGFEHALEARLVAQLHTSQVQERKTMMQQVLRFPTETALPRLRLIRPSYTLIAAALAVALFAVGLFVVSNRPPSGSTPGVMPPVGNPDAPAAQHSPTPTIPPTLIPTATPLSDAPGGPPILAEAGQSYEYTVQEGDDCLSIAYKFGYTDINAVLQIAEVNHLAAPCVLPEPGTTILVPRPVPSLLTASPTFTATPIPVIPVPTVVVTFVPVTLDPGIIVPAPSVEPRQYARPTDLRLVYIAAHDIPLGAVIGEDDVIPTYWPADQVPASIAEVLDGAVTLVGIPQWQPILVDQVASAGQ